MYPAYIYRPNEFITVVLDNQSFTIEKTNPLFEKAFLAFIDKDWEKFKSIVRPISKISSLIGKFNDIEIYRDEVYYKKEHIHNIVAQRILEFYKEGVDFEPLVKFLEKLMSNPSRRAVNELYSFLEHKQLPITENGNFLAYKGVREDYMSIFSGNATLLKGRQNEEGRIYNGIGEEIEVPRNYVEDNKDVWCSYGLHAGSLEYASNFGSNVLIVEINPADVVSIPQDCNCEKLRTCRYKVIRKFEEALTKPCYPSEFEDFEDDEDYQDGDTDYYGVLIAD